MSQRPAKAAPTKQSLRLVSVIGANHEKLPDEEVELELSANGSPVALRRGTRTFHATGKVGTRSESGARLFELAEETGGERLWLNEELTTVFED